MYTYTHTGATSIMNTYVHDKTVTRGGQEGKGMNKEKREKGGKKNWFDRLKVARDFCSFHNDVHNRNFDSKLFWIDGNEKSVNRSRRFVSSLLFVLTMMMEPC